MYDLIPNILLHKSAVLTASVIVCTVSLIQFGLWSWFVEFTRRCIYRFLTSLKGDQLLTESFIKEQEGMELEIHNVHTKDGYNLRLQRCYLKAKKGATKRVILMQHGLMETSSIYALHGENSLSFRLAREGYDVWLGNNRTNFYGQLSQMSVHDDSLTLHEKINEDSYWNYSIDELIKYDFPAMVQHIRTVTGVDKIDFMGASQGGGQAMAALTQFPEMKHMFNSLILSCPALFLQKEPKEFLLQAIMSVPMGWFGNREFLSVIAMFQLFVPLAWLKGVVGFAFMKLMGFIKRPLGDNGSSKIRARWFNWIPIGCTSVKNLAHWMDILKRGGPLASFETGEAYPFEKMLNDWERDANENGDHRPNIFVLLGGADCVIDNEMTQEVFKRCYPKSEGTDSRGTCKVLLANDYGHIDFIWSDQRSNKHIYDKLQKFLLRHNEN
jgi:pimeloyl-ACP methyl ester carboxylesterase